jgi:hypothetical protein
MLFAEGTFCTIICGPNHPSSIAYTVNYRHVSDMAVIYRPSTRKMGDSRDRGAFKAGFPGAHSRDSRLIYVCGVCAHPPRFIYILTGGLDQTYVEKVGCGPFGGFSH